MPHNAHTQRPPRAQPPPSPLSSPPLTSSFPSSSLAASKSSQPTPDLDTQYPILISPHFSPPTPLSSPRSLPFPSTHPLPPIPAADAVAPAHLIHHHATSPVRQYQSNNNGHKNTSIGRGDSEMFDPFNNAPRPKRKPYSPFSAFESSRPNNGTGAGETETNAERPTSVTSIASGYSYDAESISSSVVEQQQQRNASTKGGNGGKHRRSTLSFEIGGPEDEANIDYEASAPAHTPRAAAPAAVPAHIKELGTGDYLVARRPSTGDSSSPSSSHDVEPNSDSHPSEDPTSSAPEVDDSEERENSPADLVPPRPRYMRDSAAGERASWSSQDSSLYPTSNSSVPNSDAATVTSTDSERERDRDTEARKDALGGIRNARRSTATATTTTRAGRDRLNGNTVGIGAAMAGAHYAHPAPAPRTHAYKRRSGSYSSSTANVPPSAATTSGRAVSPGVAMSAQNPQQGTTSKPGASPYPSTRRYSGGAGAGAPHRRSGSYQNMPAPTTAAAAAAATAATTATSEIEEIPRSESPSVANSGVGPRPRGAVPPSAFRGSRTSFSNLPPGAAPPNVSTATMNGGIAVPDDAHPLSPNASSSYYNNNSPYSPSEENGYPSNTNGNGNWNGGAYSNGAGGEAASSAGHGSYVSNGSGYQYPPSPSGGQQGAYTNGAGQPQPPPQPVYPGGANYPGGGSGYPYANVPPSGLGQPVNGVPPQGGYTTPTPRIPAHNAFMANSAIARSSMSTSAVDLVPYAARVNGIAAGAYGPHSRRNSVDFGGFAPPQPPFAQATGGGGVAGYPPASPGTPGTPELRHAGSLPRLREPFLSPASRRSSSVWAPPTPAVYAAGTPGYVEGQGSGFFGGYAYNGVGNGSNTMLALPGKKEPLPSSALQRKLSTSEKPWIKKRDKGERAAWWLTFLIMWIGIAVGAVVVFFGFTGVQKITSNLCSVLEDDFSTFDTDTWTRNVSLGGFGNGEFQMTTDSSDNLYIKNGQLYIMPTLTSDEIGTASIFNGYTYNLTGCTETWNASDCSVTSNSGTHTVINPVKSARISTQKSASIAYGKVEVVAKMPNGDWLWPAIWMLPTDDKYGAWPQSGEIDIVEARGNPPTYPAQGNNFVRSSLNWGPLDSVIANLFGWQSQKRSTYAAGFHTYTLEWTSDFIRMSVDTELRAMLDLNVAKESFWTRGNFPETAQNGSTEAVVQDIWEGQPNAAPFDQEFYLIIDLAVGGTSGWFPDNVGGKMWFDGSATAMTDFANAQDTWYSTWPSSDDDRALRVDSVKMWKLC